MPRIHKASKEDSSVRMDSQEYENRSSLGHKVCRHEDRYSIEVLVESLFQDRTASWVRIERTESMQTKEEEHGASERLVAKARPRLKPAVKLSPVSIPVPDRKWVDRETQRSHDQACYQVSKAMTRLLRHDRTVPREIDGAVLFDDVLEECRKKKFDGASQWSLNDWISILAGGGGAKKRFQYCLNPNSSCHNLYLRAIQGHPGGNDFDFELQDSVPFPEGCTGCIYHVGNASELSSIIRVD